MHPNQVYRRVDQATNLAFAQNRGFGTLSVNGDDGPLVSHVPFVLGKDGATLNAHLVRSNPILKTIGKPTNAVMVVSGPDGYISPDWYGDKDQVPTWNYVAVHLRGVLRGLEAADLRAHLDQLSGSFEARLLPKSQWKTGKMTPDVLAKMMKMIVPVQMVISHVDGTWKLNQNKTDAVRLSAADHINREGFGQSVGELSDLMRNPPGE